MGIFPTAFVVKIPVEGSTGSGATSRASPMALGNLLGPLEPETVEGSTKICVFFGGGRANWSLNLDLPGLGAKLNLMIFRDGAPKKQTPFWKAGFFFNSTRILSQWDFGCFESTSSVFVRLDDIMIDGWDLFQLIGMKLTQMSYVFVQKKVICNWTFLPMTSQRGFLFIFKQIGDISDWTPWKTNISSEKWCLEDDSFPLNMVPFQGTFVHFRGGDNLIVDRVEGNQTLLFHQYTTQD